MKPHKLLLLALACTWATGAFAQWQWLDKDGRKVFSDRPPPSEVPEKNILKQPHISSRPRPAAPPVGAEANADTPVTAQATPGQGKDKQLEENKAKAEAAEAAKKKAEEQKIAAAKADNCKRAMNSKSSLDSGMRMARMNDKGEREVLDDAQRAAELKRVNAIIASDCK